MAKTVAERCDVIPVLAEIFRTYGFEGASLSRIIEGTKLGKGSLYHFFPGGKEEMAQAVLEQIDTWFCSHVFAPLREEKGDKQGIEQMLQQIEQYFQSGHRICLIGAFALGDERNRFSATVYGYFTEWIEALTVALLQTGQTQDMARSQAEEIISQIQGALVLARALDQPEVFAHSLTRIRQRLYLSTPSHLAAHP